MEIQSSTEKNESTGTVSVSLKGIPTDQGQALKDVAKARDINQSTLLREMVNASMGSIIHVFCVKSSLVASLDQDIMQYIRGSFLPAWNSVPPSPQIEAAYRSVLGVHTEDDLTQILLRNAQYLRMRASQVLLNGQQIYGGTSLLLAMFCEAASRDEPTIEAFWAGIARYWGFGGTWLRRQDFYQQINQLRGVMGLHPADGLSEAHAQGIYSRVAIFQDESGQKGLSQILLTLRTENTRALPSGVFEGFMLPVCSGHFLTPDPGYGSPFFYSNNSLGFGFLFRDETSSLHCYTVDDARTGLIQSLTEVAEALVTSVDERLRPYAATIPVHSR
ncbi:hypothetical protein [Pantoea ananatis]|uniref:hypothetical protein n=1 Tax=Pantoea ananas TaxID=553 RepID=UPI0025C8ACDE|nr:hypothetical protein [Pantoea ananatis]MDN4129867.1 hypothetical protein [Pantoea ananatis]MDN4153248.1 hypothetical protein [Pantoea ananatis]